MISSALLSRENKIEIVRRLSAFRDWVAEEEFHRLDLKVCGMDIPEFCVYCVQSERLSGVEECKKITSSILDAARDFNWLCRNGIFGLGGAICQQKFVGLLKPEVKSVAPVENMLLKLSCDIIEDASLLLIDDVALGIFVAGHFAVDVMARDPDNALAAELIANIALRIIARGSSYRVGFPWFNQEKFIGGDPGFDFGAAHGFTGAILLSRRMMQFVSQDTRIALQKLESEWYSLISEEGNFPSFSEIEEQNPVAWCYGSMVPMLMLLDTGSGRTNALLGETGLRRLLKLGEGTTLDRTICHGVPGAVHAAMLLAERTRDPVDIDAFNSWVARLITSIDEGRQAPPAFGCVIDGAGGPWIVLQSCLLGKALWDDWFFPQSAQSNGI